ncbi:MAG: ClpXP protease specificity-enhancing factor [Gammaproteobacteria bacterium]
MSDSKPLSRKPYLVRALHEWMGDSGLTPQLIVDATVTGVNVPGEFVRDGKIVLNLSLQAVRELNLGNEAITCSARFGGVARELWLPLPAVLGIYAQETGEGIAFADDDNPPPEPTPPDTDTADESASRRSHLKVVK